jgi:tRNA threonylcarbamoyladenosine biosynthesis protein TsaE
VENEEQILRTGSPGETEALGRLLGGLLHEGDFVSLRGPMGAGKTALAQGIAAGLGVEEPVCSPSFTLVHEYAGRLPVWHIDAYRLSGPGEAPDLGLQEPERAGGVTLLEWPERIAGALPADHLAIEVIPGEGDQRAFHLQPEGPRAIEVALGMFSRFGDNVKCKVSN